MTPRHDKVGNRLTETARTPSTTASSSYSYPAPAADRPHAVQQITTTGAGAATNNYQYDAAGNTTRRGPAATPQTLTWDVEGRLDTVTDSAGTTRYLYGPDGDRLLRKEPGATTLDLGTTEIRLDTASGAKASTRHYTFGGATIAARTSAGVTFLNPDHHGTAAAAGSLTRFAGHGRCGDHAAVVAAV